MATSKWLVHEFRQIYEITVYITVVSILLYAAYLVARAVYNVTLHPLAKFPGTKLRGAFYFPQFWGIYQGFEYQTIKALHDKYGDTVRLAPDVLSFNNSQAWRDIYGHRHGKKQIAKDWKQYRRNVPDIIFADDASHSRMRRLLSHAFSESALQEQEPLITSYFDLFIQKLHEQIDGPADGVIDMVRWYNFATFDLIGDLCFGESFHALENGEYHYWISTIFKGIKFGSRLQIIRAYPTRHVAGLLLRLFPSLREARRRHVAYGEEKTRARLQRQTDRRDFMTYILRHDDEKGMSEPEIMANCRLLIAAGSETTATLLSGVTYHLLKNPETIEKVTREVRAAFSSNENITFTSVAQLPYLQACLKEGLRMYPPVPSTLPRRTGPQGDSVDGQYIPPDTSVGVHQWSTNQSSRNFHKPQHFIPERWLGDEAFAGDDLSALQAFSMGPRNCLGKNLAYAEMRSILARVLWHFDMELGKDSEDWCDQKVFALWDKKPLNIKLGVRKMKA